ncbi:hypothetical protein Bbelb_364200 [Branchiostoma belcheri]|nr:hypothetical protein Bbelb_364200 [Branchiostoma belcheri]
MGRACKPRVVCLILLTLLLLYLLPWFWSGSLQPASGFFNYEVDELLGQERQGKVQESRSNPDVLTVAGFRVDQPRQRKLCPPGSFRVSTMETCMPWLGCKEITNEVTTLGRVGSGGIKERTWVPRQGLPAGGHGFDVLGLVSHKLSQDRIVALLSRQVLRGTQWNWGVVVRATLSAGVATESIGIAMTRAGPVLNGKTTSAWKSPLAGVPQGSVLGPTLFILYINDLATSRTECLANLFADNTSLSFSHHSVQRVVATLNRELSTVSTLLSTWKLEANIDKCKVMFITTRTLPQPIPPVTLGGTVLQVVSSHKHLGVTLTNTLSWSQHIEVISTKARRSSGLLCALRRKIPQNALLRLYITITRPTY